jgi:hypothetical protein
MIASEGWILEGNLNPAGGPAAGGWGARQSLRGGVACSASGEPGTLWWSCAEPTGTGSLSLCSVAAELERLAGLRGPGPGRLARPGPAALASRCLRVCSDGAGESAGLGERGAFVAGRSVRPSRGEYPARAPGAASESAAVTARGQ